MATLFVAHASAWNQSAFNVTSFIAIARPPGGDTFESISLNCIF